MEIVAYDRTRAERLLLEWTPQRLLDEVEQGAFDAALGVERAAALRELALAWVQRALGPLPLRDALLVDGARCALAWDLLCEAMVRLRFPAPAGLASGPLDALALPDDAPWAAPLRAAAADGLALATLPARDAPRFPAPPDLATLLPPPPRALPPRPPDFEQPAGPRRVLATALALLGAAIIGVPLLLGQEPTRTAGMPLALITAALLVGIRAGPMGYAGSLCIWLVANLPNFHHGSLLGLWPAIPLLCSGLVLLYMDKRVRAMWRWIRHNLPIGRR
jgi:hypothetical protein